MLFLDNPCTTSKCFARAVHRPSCRFGLARYMPEYIFQVLLHSWKDSVFLCRFGIMTTSLRPFWDWTPRAIGSFWLLVGRSCKKSMYSSCQIWALTLSDRWRSIGTTLEVKVPVTADAADAIASPIASATAMLGVPPTRWWCCGSWVVEAAHNTACPPPPPPPPPPPTPSVLVAYLQQR